MDSNYKSANVQIQRQSPTPDEADKLVKEEMLSMGQKKPKDEIYEGGEEEKAQDQWNAGDADGMNATML